MPDELFLTPAAAKKIRGEITRARGNEVCFIAAVDEAGGVRAPRVVARGNKGAVLAAVRDAAAGSLVLHNHPSGELEPSDPDLRIASELYGLGVGLAITDNEARELYVVLPPYRARELEQLSEAAVAGALEPDGAVARGHPNYEDRPAQREMARMVARLYNEGGVGLLEAGTGTGKSVAYLIPALAWAGLNKERTVVSTNTINLQEQLVEKDLPFLRRTLGEPFRYALVKGRHNYISIRRANLAASMQGALFEGAQQRELEALREWLKTTRDGSLQDLPFTPSPELWDEVVSDSDVCLRGKCPHFEACFYQKARRDAAGADVLVVNHHLLFSDLAVRRAQGNWTAPAVLPPYRRLVLDEAHNLEDAATSHLGASVSQRGLLRVFGRLERRGRGVLRAVEDRLAARASDLIQQNALRRIEREIRPALDQARDRAMDLFGRLERLAAAAPDGVLRYEASVLRESEAWTDGMQVAWEALVAHLQDVVRNVGRLAEDIRTDRSWADALQEQLVELDGAASRLRGALDALQLAFGDGPEGIALVRWLERKGGPTGGVSIEVAPVDLSEVLRESLFERVDTAVLTSATLSTRAGFSFIRDRLGLGAGGIKLRESVFPSPFDFATQTLLAIPTDLPAPRGDDGPAFDDATAAVAYDVAAASDGGIFVLLTSYRALRNVAVELRRRGAESRWPMFVQGEAPRARLLERFAESGRGVLLGVASFWEGVDVPGQPLRGLVIPKLPFKVPGEPLTSARIEAIDEGGGNSFRDYLLPHAALRLKQGFGRLVRSREDRGVVVLLDRRVLEKSYGRYFLESLPEAARVTGPWAEVRGRVGEFYEREFAEAETAVVPAASRSR